MKTKTVKQRRQVTLRQNILSRHLEQSHLIKLQRMFLKHSTRPELMYQDTILLDYPNPAMDSARCQTLDEHFEVDYLLHNLYRKLLLPNRDKEALDKAAYSAFFKGERKNVRTNKRLSSIAFSDERTNTFVFRVQRLIGEILGIADLDMIAELSRFSSGATADLPLKKAAIQDKYAMINPSFTRPAHAMFAHYVSRIDGTTGAERFVACKGNRVLTVPKSNTTNRTIAAEPTMNMYFQLGVGSWIRKRLRRFGVNLNDQTINQRLAYEGSISGDLATIDLENASNSVSYEVVKLLLPRSWFEILDALRSPYGLVKGRLHRYRMFSSMGNGFTFELESLIFFAICKCACPRGSVISVYGDDIIVPTQYADEVIHWLDFFGFSTNASKSFTSGHFRESCGKHYHSGYDVSPFFVRKLPKGFDIFLLFNNMVRWSTKLGLDIRFLDTLRYVLSFIPEDSRIYGPDGYGDGHLLEVSGVTNETEFKYSKKLCSLTFKSYVRSYNRKLANQAGALCASLLGLTQEQTMSYNPDTTVYSYRVKTLSVLS